MSDQIKFNSTCDGCVEVAVSVAAGSPTVTVVDTNGTLGTVTAGNTGTFNDYLYNGNSTTISIPDGNTVAAGKITGTIKYTSCATPTPAPPTPSTTPNPTPTATAAAAPLISGGTSCFALENYPSSYGSGNQKTITFTASGVLQSFQFPSDQYWVFMNNPFQVDLIGCDQFVMDFIASGKGHISGAMNGAYFLGNAGLTSIGLSTGYAPSYPASITIWANL